MGIGQSTMTDNRDRAYTSKIIRAGALLPETKTLLAYWDETLSVTENLGRAQRQNIFGKASRSWINQFLRSFRERYLADGPTAQALVTLVKNDFPAVSLDWVLLLPYSPGLISCCTMSLTEDSAGLSSNRGRIEVFPADIQARHGQWLDR